MDQDLQVDGNESAVTDVPAAVQPPASYPKWPWLLAGFLIAIGIAIAITWPITVPYYTLSPGPVYDTSDFITVEDGYVSEVGELLFWGQIRKRMLH